MIRAALVPVKPRRRAKQRLRPVLGPHAHLLVTRAMLRDVLACLLDSLLFVTVAVVTRDRLLRRDARRRGVHALLPPPGLRGLNPELSWAAAQPELSQVDRLLVLPGDVPGVRLSDLYRLVLPPIERGVRIAPSADGGTNGLLLVPPGVIPFRFGPDSAARHRAACVAAGVPYQVLELPSLSADVDHPEDLHAAGRIAGPRTRHLLAAIEGGRIRYRRRVGRPKRHRHYRR